MNTDEQRTRVLEFSFDEDRGVSDNLASMIGQIVCAVSMDNDLKPTDSAQALLNVGGGFAGILAKASSNPEKALAASLLLFASYATRAAGNETTNFEEKKNAVHKLLRDAQANLESLQATDAKVH